MFLRASTKSVLEKSLGVTAKELAKMDYDQEISFVKSKTGKKPVFSKVVDHRIVARGNHTIATKRIMTMEEVDKQIAGWKRMRESTKVDSSFFVSIKRNWMRFLEHILKISIRLLSNLNPRKMNFQ